jgi:hypothetical protein
VLLLGRSGDAAVLLLRFAVPIPEDDSVVEAYVLLDRSEVVESDPQPISLHAARIIDAWDGRSISFERQPRWEETGSPGAIVTGTERPLIRVDVRDLVKHWKTHDPRDQGIAIVADDTSRTGMAFAATAVISDEGSNSMLGTQGHTDQSQSTWAVAPPRLELYLRPAIHETHLNLPAATASNAEDAGKPIPPPAASSAARAPRK